MEIGRSAKCWFCLCCHSSLTSLSEVSGHSGPPPFPFQADTPLTGFYKWVLRAHALCLVPTLTGSASEASRPDHNGHWIARSFCSDAPSQPSRGVRALLGSVGWFLMWPWLFHFSLMCPLLTSPHQTPTSLGPDFCLLTVHSSTADGCCSQWPDPLPWLPSYTLHLASNSPALALSQPHVLSLKDPV